MTILTKKENLIQGFSGYEQFLYFTTGSNPYTWPKEDADSTQLYLTTSETSKIKSNGGSPFNTKPS